MKFISWNVNGMRAARKAGLDELLNVNADIYSFQETKVTERLSDIEKEGYYCYWSFSKKKGYSGTAVMSRWKPLNVYYDMSYGDNAEHIRNLIEGLYDDTYLNEEDFNSDKVLEEEFDYEGRIITLEFETFYFINCYVPNSLFCIERLEYRKKWDIRLLIYVASLKAKKPVIICGDLNVTLSGNDFKVDRDWEMQIKYGFATEERERIWAMLDIGLIDTYRYLHPDATGFTWWSHKYEDKLDKKGRRLDYFLLDTRMEKSLKESNILSKIKGSDHLPIVMEISVPYAEIRKRELSIFKEKEEFYRLEKGYVLKVLFETPRTEMFNSLSKADLSQIWESIDWEKTEEHVKNFQKKLAYAAYAGDKDKIKYYQNKISGCIEAKLLAVRFVCNYGTTPGIDGVAWSSPDEKFKAALSLTQKNYHAMPRIDLHLNNGKKTRIVQIATYYDRAMNALYAMTLDPIAEAWGDKKSFAYRKGRSQLDANEYIRRAFNEYGISSYTVTEPPRYAFKADIKQFYSSISQDWILENIPMNKKVLKEFIDARRLVGGQLYTKDNGIGLGLRLSPIIANMTLDGMQDFIYKHLYPEGDIDYANGNLIRFSDDVIVITRNRETAERVGQLIREFLWERGLALSEEKSGVVNVYRGFEFMSKYYIYENNAVYVYPSQRAVEKFKIGLSMAIENHVGTRKSLIKKLNRKLIGWANYHKYSDAEKYFKDIDVFLKLYLLRFSEKRCKSWSTKRVINYYFVKRADGRFTYGLKNDEKARIIFISETISPQYIPVSTKKNPYIDTEYYDERLSNRSKRTVTGIYRKVWDHQNGKCFYCGCNIMKDELREIVEIDGDTKKVSDRYAYVHVKCMDDSVEYIDTDYFPKTIKELDEFLEKRLRIVN